jgi:hypothetical protein
VSAASNKSSNSGDYDRPNQQYRCGRGAGWRTPCPNGPNGSQCGGTCECTPVLKDGRYECRRPASAGGPCKLGPKPDGTCSQTHPPCVPRLTLRARRGRLVWQLGVVLLLILAAGFHFGHKGRFTALSADPGPLSAKHAHFTREQGCAACHAAHGAGPGGLISAVFTAADANSQCGVCHQFAGPADRPHNETTPAHAAAKATDCRLCHTEHRGATGNITPLTDAQCHACHAVKFTRFDLDHPPFPTNFPHFTRGAIQFNHAKHLLDYFKQPEHASRAQQSCAECHMASPTDKTIRTAGFDVACARCHAGQIPQNELVLLRLPELPADPSKLGTEDATSFMSWLLQRPGGTNFGAALQQLLAAIAKDGAAPLESLLNEPLAGQPATNGLLQTFSPALLHRPAQQWLKKERIEPTASSAQGGWFWFDDLYPELRYKPTGHSDPVIRAWLEYATAAVASSTNADDAKRAATFRDELANARTGPGRCLKCHVASTSATLPEHRRIAWNYLGSELRPHVRFSHGAHLGVRRCGDCHALNPQADYEQQFTSPTTVAGASNFRSIGQTDCVACHAHGKVRNDCRMCHEYHRGHSILNSVITLK